MLKGLLYLRGVLAAAFVCFWTGVFASWTAVAGGIFRSQHWVTLGLRFWGRTLLAILFVKVSREGVENVPTDPRGFLYVFNHSSHFDIPIMLGWLPREFRFGAKAELFKIPIFGLAMKAAGALKIHRGERSRVLKLYQDSIARIDRGDSFALAPEGTRNPDEGINRFKTGPFIFAINAQMPVVPVVIYGARSLLPKGDLLPVLGQWNSSVRVKILPAVETRGMMIDQLDELRTKVRDIMVQAYTEG